MQKAKPLDLQETVGKNLKHLKHPESEKQLETKLGAVQRVNQRNKITKTN